MPQEKWKVLYDKVLVERDRPETEKAGLAVPEVHQKQQSQGTVLAVGEGRVEGVRMRPLTLRPGYRVKFSLYSGVPLDDAHPDLVLLREDEILAYQEPHLEEVEKKPA